ncbi:MAG TPA: cytochrome c [Rhizomicrobium sp.]|nr:cytochrome c [Rhizomicrobium sp.]
MMNSRFSVALVSVVIFVAAVLLIAAGVALSGLYNVAADARQMAITERLLAFVRERSVDARAEDTKVPLLIDPQMIADGAAHYNAMCTGCHLAPGMAENEMRPGMNPKPPQLAVARAESNPAEDFWIIKHGIKMTAMPAWGVTHSDAEIWDIVAFLQRLPRLSPEQYRALAASGHHDMDNMDMSGH